MHRLKWILAGGAILLLSLSPTSQAEFKVGKVIKVEKADWAPFLGPLRWSPSGDRIAFWSGNELRLADTTGAVVYSKAFDKPPRKYEWVNDSTICIGQMYWIESRKQYNGILTINLSSGLINTLAEEIRTPAAASDTNHIFVDGPNVSLEGRVYYDKWTEQRNPATRSIALKRIRPVVSTDTELATKTDHLIRWDRNQISIVSLDDMDTVLLGRPGEKGFRKSEVLASSRVYVANGGALYIPGDNTFVSLDTIGLRIPAGFNACGFMFHSFSDRFRELAVQRNCDSISENPEVTTSQVVVIDLNTFEATYLEDSFHCKSSLCPAFSPDGKRLAFIADGLLFLVMREVE